MRTFPGFSVEWGIVKEEKQRQREDRHVKKEAETGVICTHQGTPGTTRSLKR